MNLSMVGWVFVFSAHAFYYLRHCWGFSLWGNSCPSVAGTNYSFRCIWGFGGNLEIARVSRVEHSRPSFISSRRKRWAIGDRRMSNTGQLVLVRGRSLLVASNAIQNK